jgi:nucleoside-diphosphate-sugar epimerase
LTNPKSQIRNPKSCILITGANGFVGSNLYDHFSDDFHIMGIDITGPGKYSPENFFGWEDLDKLPPVDVIIHLAGKAHDTSNTAREEDYFEVNLGLTQKIFDYFLNSPARKFIFFSSVKAVADTVKGEWLTEEDDPDPQTPYGRSKLAAEHYIMKRLRDEGTSVRGGDLSDLGERSDLREGVMNLKNETIPEIPNPQSEITNHKSQITNSSSGIPHPKSQIRNPKFVYILRPAMIHGPGNKGNLNLLYKVVKKGIPWPLGAFENQRSFTSMDNLSFIIRQLIKRDIAPGTYQVADDETLSTHEIIRLISSSLVKKSKIWCIPARLIRILAKLGNFFNLPLNNERLKKLTETYRVSNIKIKAALGIEKMPVSARYGLLKTIESFKI